MHFSKYTYQNPRRAERVCATLECARYHDHHHAPLALTQAIPSFELPCFFCRYQKKIRKLFSKAIFLPWPRGVLVV